MTENKAHIFISIGCLLFIFIFLVFGINNVKSSGLGGISAGIGLFFAIVIFSYLFAFIHSVFILNIKKKICFFLIDTSILILGLLYLTIITFYDGTFSDFYFEIIIYLIGYFILLFLSLGISIFINYIFKKLNNN